MGGRRRGGGEVRSGRTERHSGGAALSPPAVPGPFPPPLRAGAALLLAMATVLLIAMERAVPGGAAWLAGLALALRDRDPAFRRRISVVFGVVLLLAFAPIQTDTSTRHFLILGAFFLAVILGPWLILRRTDPGTISWNLIPKRFRWRDLIYVVVSIPLSWLALRLYFFTVNPEVATHWVLPSTPEAEATWRLIIGINCVGVWDEVFFINTVYGILRTVYPRRFAIALQGVVYASVLNDMAFTGIGPILVYILALTQASMYEGSRSLLWVIVVHLIIDFFLVEAILHFYYPAMSLVY